MIQVLPEHELQVFHRRHRELMNAADRSRVVGIITDGSPSTFRRPAYGALRFGRNAADLLASRIGHVTAGFARQRAPGIQAGNTNRSV